MIRKTIALAFFFVFFITVDDSGATIQLPQTGQVSCYINGDLVSNCSDTGQDGDTRTGVQWPNPRFTAVYCDVTGPCADQGSDCDANPLNDTVTDNLTGLMWARSGNLFATGQGQTWDKALEFANNLILCGHDDWRLPNINELESLVNAGEPDVSAWLTTQGFHDDVASPSRIDFWSSTTSIGNTALIFAARLVGAGDIQGLSKLSTYLKALPVRGETTPPAQIWRTGQDKCYVSQAPWDEMPCAGTGQDGDLQAGVPWSIPRFEIHGDTVADRFTNLMWAKDAASQGPPGCSPGSYQTWDGALEFVKCLNDNNYLGGSWRLPNRKELRSLLDYGVSSGLPAGHPFKFANFRYWSSTTVATDGGNPATKAWHFPMGGTVMPMEKTDASWCFVWPVKTYVVPTVISPAAGEVIDSGSDYTISWTVVPGSDSSNVSYSTNNGETWSPIQTTLANLNGVGGQFAFTGSFTGTSASWSVPLLTKNKTKCLIKVTAYEKGKKIGKIASAQPFTIEVLTITGPSSSSTCTSGVPCPITWYKAARVDAQKGKLYYSIDGGVNWKLITNTLTGSNTGWPDWQPPVYSTKKNCKVKLVYKDGSGKTVGTAISGKFTIKKP